MTHERPSRNLTLLIQGQFISNMGNQIFDIAMLLWIKKLAGPAAIMGLAVPLTGLPTALLAPFGGSIADRFGHLRVVILSDLISATAVSCVMAVVLLQPDPALAITALCLGNLILGLSTSCSSPAAASALKRKQAPG